MTTFRSDFWNECTEPCTRRDYLAFLGYSAAPALIPLLLAWGLQGLSFRELINGGSLYLVVIGACGTLTYKSLVAQRIDDREQAHLWVFVVLLLACIGFGLSVALKSDGVLDPNSFADFRARSDGLSVGLLLIALGPVGLNTSRVTSRAMKRAKPARRADDLQPQVILDQSEDSDPIPHPARRPTTQIRRSMVGGSRRTYP